MTDTTTTTTNIQEGPSEPFDNSKSFSSERQGLVIYNIIELFELDITKILEQNNVQGITDSTSILRFVNGIKINKIIHFEGFNYIPANIDADGFEWKSQSNPPKPKLQISNLDNQIGIFASAIDDFIGAKFIRKVTLAKYCAYQDTNEEGTTIYRQLNNDAIIDNIETFNDNAGILQPDEFLISRKTNHNNKIIEFELATELDQQNQKLPSRIMLRNFCSHTYRYLNPTDLTGTTFIDITTNPEQITCPYIADETFNENNEGMVPNNKDVCSKTVEGCRARFHRSDKKYILPFSGFPGLADYRR